MIMVPYDIGDFYQIAVFQIFPLIRGYYDSICLALLVISNLSNYIALSFSAHVSQKAKWC